jgi:hypothetical protein
MEIPRESHTDAKKRAREFYKNIGCVWCPALNECVIFDSAGFRHLIQKTVVPRAKTEQRNRFMLLPHAVSILSNAHGIDPLFTIRMVKRVPTKFYAFIEIVDKMRITVVIKKSEAGKYHFCSVYSR